MRSPGTRLRDWLRRRRRASAAAWVGISDLTMSEATSVLRLRRHQNSAGVAADQIMAQRAWRRCQDAAASRVRHECGCAVAHASWQPSRILR